jgi:hypothetical protein
MRPCNSEGEIRPCDCNYKKVTCHCSDSDCDWDPDPVKCVCQGGECDLLPLPPQ